MKIYYLFIEKSGDYLLFPDLLFLISMAICIMGNVFMEKNTVSV